MRKGRIYLCDENIELEQVKAKKQESFHETSVYAVRILQVVPTE